MVILLDVLPIDETVVTTVDSKLFPADVVSPAMSQ